MANRTRSVLAAQAFERIKKLQTECDQELARSPEAIRAKYAERIAKVRDGLDPDLQQYVDGLMAAEARLGAVAPREEAEPEEMPEEAPKGKRR